MIACLLAVFLAAPIQAQTKDKTPAKSVAAAPTKAAAKSGDLLDLNSATVDQLKALPQGAAQHIRGIATGYVHDRFPLLPQQAGCVVAYWGTTLKPDVARSVIASYMATPLGSAGIRRSD